MNLKRAKMRKKFIATTTSAIHTAEHNTNLDEKSIWGANETNLDHKFGCTRSKLSVRKRVNTAATLKLCFHLRRYQLWCVGRRTTVLHSSFRDYFVSSLFSDEFSPPVYSFSCCLLFRFLWLANDVQPIFIDVWNTHFCVNGSPTTPLATKHSATKQFGIGIELCRINHNI